MILRERGRVQLRYVQRVELVLTKAKKSKKNPRERKVFGTPWMRMRCWFCLRSSSFGWSRTDVGVQRTNVGTAHRHDFDVGTDRPLYLEPLYHELFRQTDKGGNNHSHRNFTSYAERQERRNDTAAVGNMLSIVVDQIYR